jgi:hypothetical protein
MPFYELAQDQLTLQHSDERIVYNNSEKKRNFYIILIARHMYTHDTYTRYNTCLDVPAPRCIRVPLMHNACMRVSRMMCPCVHTSRLDHMRLCHMMTCASRRDYMNLVLVAVLVQP